MVRKLFVIAATAVSIAVLLIAIKSQKQYTAITIGSQVINVEIANTSQKREHGLCCRESLPADQGMLFVYKSPGDYRFWMKDTQIPLDMFWIDSDKRIVHIERNVRPSSYPQSYGTKTPAQYVLETNAGFADKFQIKNRDIVAFTL